MHSRLLIFIFSSLSTIAAGQISLLKDISPISEPTSTGIDPKNIVSLNNRLYFVGNSKYGRELYISDGTPTGTRIVKDIFPGHESSNPRNLTVAGNLVYFLATDGVGDFKLWRTDGTEPGTFMVLAIENVNNTSSFIGNLTSGGDKLYFSVYPPNFNRYKHLWVTDGTIDGTYVIKELAVGNNNLESEPLDLITLQNVSYLTLYTEANGGELWRTDGTVSGTSIVKDISPGSGSGCLGSLSNCNGLIYFTGYSVANGAEVWRTDGTEAGTVMVADVVPGPNSSSPSQYIQIGSDVFIYSIFEGIWKTNGTSAGTTLVKKMTIYERIVELNGAAYFVTIKSTSLTSFQCELWRSDGTPEGTTFLNRLSSGQYVRWSSFGINGPLKHNGYLYFTAPESNLPDVSNRYQIWRTDGTAVGLEKITTLRDNSTIGTVLNQTYLTKNDNRIYFNMANGTSGSELWYTIGDPGDQHMVLDWQSILLWPETSLS